MKTAVEWLSSKLSITFQTMYNEEIEQAKQMEKEQIISTYLDGIMHPLEMEATKQAEQYYNENYLYD